MLGGAKVFVNELKFESPLTSRQESVYEKSQKDIILRKSGSSFIRGQM